MLESLGLDAYLTFISQAKPKGPVFVQKKGKILVMIFQSLFISPRPSPFHKQVITAVNLGRGPSGLFLSRFYSPLQCDIPRATFQALSELPSKY